MADSYWAYRSLLCHFNGTNGSQSFVDEKGHTLTAYNASAFIGTADSVFGGAALELAQATGSAVKTTDSAGEFAFSGDFEIRLRVKFTQIDNNSRQVLVAYGHDATDQDWWELALTKGTGSNALKLTICVGGTQQSLSFTNGPGSFIASINTWYAIAIKRVGSTVTAYLSGAVQGSGSMTNSLTATGKRLDIGGLSYDGSTISERSYCRIDELRITNGMSDLPASGGYTVETAEFETGAGTLTLATATAHLVYTGYQTTLPTYIRAATGHLVYNGQPALVAYGPYYATQTGHLSFTGKTADVFRGVVLTATTGHLAYSGKQASIFVGLWVGATTGHLVNTGKACAVQTTRRVSTATGRLSYTGSSPSLARAIQPITGRLTYSGKLTVVARTNLFAPGAGRLAYTGHQPAITQPKSLASGSGNLSYSGHSGIVIQASAALFEDVAEVFVRPVSEKQTAVWTP